MMNTTIRNAALEDAERILEIYAYYVEHTAVSFEYTAPTLPEFQNLMKKTLERYPLGYTKAGTFHKCGYKFHRWYDMIWMEKIIGAHQ